MGALRSVVTSLVVVVCGFGLAATAVGASPSGPNGPGQPIIGNVVGGDSPADRTTLGADENGCTATVEAGRGHDRYGAPVVHHYTIPGLTDFENRCPNMGVTVRRPDADVRDLVVTWFIEPPGPAHDMYLLRHLSVLSGSSAMDLPNYIGTRDFNGDGRGDVWEITDEGEGLTTYLRQGRGFVPGPAKVYEDSVIPTPAFGRLDDTPGTDLATAFMSRVSQPGLPDSAGGGVVVVFGATGASVLLEHDEYIVLPAVAIVDANRDGHDDVQVTGGVLDSGEPGGLRIYLGDGHGNFRRQG